MKLLQNLGRIFILSVIPVFLNAISLSLEISKDKVYVGEAIVATLSFKYDENIDILNTDLEDFTSKHFWIKELESSKEIVDGFVYINQTYFIFPQSSGKLVLDKQLINIAQREAKTNLILWSKVYSKIKSIEVLNLPKGINVQGDYKIEALIDKQEVNANSPVNLTLKIEGNGNLDDIEDFTLNHSSQLVFSAKSTIKIKMDNNIYQGRFTQKFSIIGDKDFIIPPLIFSFFNTKTKSIKTIKTKPFNIKVNSVVNNKQGVVKTKDNSILKYIYGILGLFIGLLLAFTINQIKRVKKVELKIVEKIKKAKNDKALYLVLLPYSQKASIVDVMKKLEDNIYKNSKSKINKKDIIKIFNDKN